MHCLVQAKEANFICLYYYAYADEQICGAVNESSTYLESACIAIFNSTDRWVCQLTVWRSQPMAWFSEGAEQVLWNVIGGAVTAGLFEAYVRGRRCLTGRKYRALFGNDVETKDFHLVFGLLSLKPLVPADSHPYRKSGLNNAILSIETPVSACELRAVKYLSESIAENGFSSPRVLSDFDVESRLDLSFVSFGGPLSNFKSRDALDSENSFVEIDEQGQFRRKSTGELLVTIEPDFDYGLILKTHPSQFPKRTWFVCAGLGEWGSSGSAWYLGKKWTELQAFAKADDFVIIVRVRQGQDEYAESIFRERVSA